MAFAMVKFSALACFSLFCEARECGRDICETSRLCSSHEVSHLPCHAMHATANLASVSVPTNTGSLCLTVPLSPPFPPQTPGLIALISPHILFNYSSSLDVGVRCLSNSNVFRQQQQKTQYKYHLRMNHEYRGEITTKRGDITFFIFLFEVIFYIFCLPNLVCLLC